MIIVGPIPEVGHDVPSVNHVALITNRDVNIMIAPSITEFLSRNEKILRILSRLEYDMPVSIVSPSRVLCDNDICRVVLDDGLVLYRDDNHLSTAGAKYISGIFDELFASSP